MHVVCLSAGVLQINQPISLTMIEPISWLTFDGDLVRRRITDHFFISLTITDYDILGDLLAFLIQSPAACHETERNKCSRRE